MRCELESLASAKAEAGQEVGRLKREWAALKRRSDEEVEAVEKLKDAKIKAEEELERTRESAALANSEVRQNTSF